MAQPKIKIVENYEDLCVKAVQEILDLSSKKIAMQNKFTLVLSGGSTPKGIYQSMASPLFRDKFSWENIHFFWGDERWVPPEDQRSNFRMATEALFTKVKIPSANIHPIPTKEADPRDSASMYEGTISAFFKLKKGDFPVFDLILLGLGQDGHTASLFPGNPSLSVKDRLVIATSQKGIPEQRITLTLPTINHADTIFFLVSGLDKANITAEVLERKGDSLNCPLFFLEGHICWFLDKAAASKLRD